MASQIKEFSLVDILGLHANVLTISARMMGLGSWDFFLKM
jgi:hypothetical protein